MPPKKPANWIQKADREMERSGTEGSFTAKAKRAGKSTQAYATAVIRKYKGKPKTAAQMKLFRQALFARNVTK